jgi:hypothetical protein
VRADSRRPIAAHTEHRAGRHDDFHPCDGFPSPSVSLGSNSAISASWRGRAWLTGNPCSSAACQRKLPVRASVGGRYRTQVERAAPPSGPLAPLRRERAGVCVVHKPAGALPAFRHVVPLGRQRIAGLHRRVFRDHLQLTLTLRTSLVRNGVPSTKERHVKSPGVDWSRPTGWSEYTMTLARTNSGSPEKICISHCISEVAPQSCAHARNRRQAGRPA